MSGLENLIDKILKDAQSEARSIEEMAKAKAQEIIDAAAAQAQLEAEQILTDAKAEAAHNAQQIVLGRTLEIRDKNLEAKQQVLDKVFSQALEKLNSLPLEQYKVFIKNCLENIEPEGQEIIFPQRYGINSVADLNEYLVKTGKKGELKLGKGDVSGGFILKSGGVEENNTFEALLDYRRYTLESEVLKTLY